MKIKNMLGIRLHGEYIRTLNLRYASMIFALFCCGCSGGGGSSPAANSVQGTDLSGVYSLAGVGCYNLNSPGAATHSAAFSDAHETITIAGNSYTSSSTSGGCTITGSAGVVFNSSSNQATFTNWLVNTATGGSCTYNYTEIGNSITPTSLAVTQSSGQVIGNKTDSYLLTSSPSGIAILTTAFSDGVGSDTCFLVFNKQ